MKLKLSEWASVAEIVSGIAVVVTLIFLVLGIRENTGVTRLSIYSDIIDGFNDMEARIWADPELTLLFDAYISEQTDRLSEQEQTRVGLIALTQFRGLEKAFFANEYGAIGPDEWERIQAFAVTMGVQGQLA